MSTDRNPRDGRPYYCAVCGAGFGEYLACEMPDCKLETEAEAAKRTDAEPEDDEWCEGCGASLRAGMHITGDDVWLCRQCYDAVPPEPLRQPGPRSTR